MSKEEKAKEYAMLSCGYYAPDCKPEYCNSKCQWFINSHVHENTMAFRKGYTAAEQDLSSQLTAYKEALTAIVESLEILNLKNAVVTPKDALENHFELLDKAITKAKTLIE